MIELYGLGATSISRLFDEMIEPPREIIDVEYEDISDQEILEDSDSIPVIPIQLERSTRL